ncbi:MAG: transporter substrate-binding domain-containing protein [Janthinobacterium lividum]
MQALRRAVLVLSLWAGVAHTQDAHAQDGPPLRTAVDGTFAPFAFPSLSGGVQGFSVDLFTEVARRLHRPITIDSTSYSGLIPALDAGRYDFLAAPTTVTKERAENLLFASGYMWTAFQFGIKKGTAPITSLQDLRGKVITVNKGSAYHAWATANAATYGFVSQAYDSQSDAVQAVLAGRAAANLGGNAVIRYAATKLPQFQPDFVIKETRAQWAAPFRKDEATLRNQVQDAMSCMKRDGSLAKLSEKWFGVPPAADDLERVVDPGYGVPGMPGYDPAPHELNCT